MSSPATAVVLTAVQLPGCSGDAETDISSAEAGVRKAARRGADLVLLPELSTLPYFCAEPAGAFRGRAEPVTGALTRRFAALARELRIVLAFGLFEVDDRTGHTYNSVVVLASDGTVVPAVDRAGIAHPTTRKLHLPVGEEPAPGFDETAHFTPGDFLGLHTVDGLNIGVLICYDRRFPECWRELRSLGAQVVLVPMAGDGGDGADFVVAEIRTHARENGLVVVAASKTGFETVGGRRVGNIGESVIVGADGAVLSIRHDLDGPGVVGVAVDIDEQMQVRRRLRYFDHRRVDLFGGPLPMSTEPLEIA